MVIPKVGREKVIEALHKTHQDEDFGKELCVVAKNR